jgi:polysaccharide export outer membrane protein
LSLLLLISASAFAQTKAVPEDPDQAAFQLGPGDQVTVKVLDAEEISTGTTPIRIDGRGMLTLPVIGALRAAGLTTTELQRIIEERLKKYVRDPDVTVHLLEMHSRPISILGAVQQPGVHQVHGEKTLFEAISLAGGLRPDAGHSINITRKLKWGRIPLPSAHDDPTGQFSVASIDIRSILGAKNPEENILICPQDVISVPRSDLVYVVGAVRKPGGFVLNERETISALQALSLAEGLAQAAASKDAKVMRTAPGTEKRIEIPVNIQLIMAGRNPDVALHADDILFVPVSGAKNATLRGMEAALQMATGIVIYRR